MIVSGRLVVLGLSLQAQWLLGRVPRGLRAFAPSLALFALLSSGLLPVFVIICVVMSILAFLGVDTPTSLSFAPKASSIVPNVANGSLELGVWANVQQLVAG